MMEHRSLDPYEQQLLKVFDSYDYENRGSLDRDGLTQLCQTLQLEERGTELIKCLLNDSKHTRATFSEFKDALLALLGNIQNESASEIDGSPEREVSPKFVYGSKKYGRRSRPRGDEISPIKERSDMKYVNKTHNVSVQRSNSQSEVMYSKKRKTNSNLKRCTSFPGNHLFENHDYITSNNFGNQELVYTESMLREAWKNLGVGEDGYLNQTELILVCDAIGLRELANGVLRQFSDKLIDDFDHRISFQELLEVLQQDDAWVDVLNSTPKNEETLNINLSCVSNDSVFLNSKSVQYVTLGPKGNGYINIDTVIEMWESAGITSPKHLLNELGFTSSDIDIVELASVLEKEIKGINESRSDFSNPHIALLQAILALYQSEIRCLKNIMEQMEAEREKLKCDVGEANNRATLLAQEVDDNHAKMEHNTQKQVKLLEQRHTDILKQMTEQCSNEKDQLTILNKSLGERISNLESEEANLRNDLDLAQKYLSSVEKDNHKLSGQVVELQQIREMLSEQVKILEGEKLKCHESDQLQMESLLSKLTALQLENSQLRDKNDEMQTEIESLTNEVCAMRLKISNTSSFTLENSMDENISVICEGVGHGSKRRSDDSPSKDFSVLGLGDGSPRLGKVRKFHKNKDVLEAPFTSSESGFETELDCIDSSLSNSCNENEETIARLQAKIDTLEQILIEHSVPLPANFHSQTESEASSSSTVFKLTKRCTHLEKMLTEFKTDVNRIFTTNRNHEDIKTLNEKLERLISETESSDAFFELMTTKRTLDASTSTENDDTNEQIQKYIDEKKAVVAECEELKNCLELLENEYEKCEKYWSGTLEDERKVFEQEQNQYSEHLAQLMQKITEYEEEFVRKNSRLPPIEEKCKLEEQFTDLEHEFEDYKEQAEFQMEEKDREIQDLKEKLDEVTNDEKTDVSIQTEMPNLLFDLDNKINNLTNHVVESTNLFSSDTMPYTLSVENAPQSLDTPDTFIWSKESIDNTMEAQPILNQTDSPASLPVNISFQNAQTDVKQSVSMFELPSTSNDIEGVTHKNSTPLRPKRTRKHDRNSLGQKLYKRNQENAQEALPCKWRGFDDLRSSKVEDTVALPVSAVHNMNVRLHHLEQRCRHLQLVLKQQHYHDEQILQHYWQQYRSEKGELHFLLKNAQEKLDRQIRLCNEQLDRLARTDMLVKDLYIENAFLVANVQRLEQKCHMLTQCNSNNSV